MKHFLAKLIDTVQRLIYMVIIIFGSLIVALIPKWGRKSPGLFDTSLERQVLSSI